MSGKRTPQSRARGAVALLWRSLVVALGYTLAVMIGGMITQALRLPTPSIAGGVDQTQILVVTFLSGLLIALALGPLSRRLALPTAQRALLLFVVIFMLNALINLIEALFFTSSPPAEQVTALVNSGVGHIGLALLLGVLFQPASVDNRLPTALRETLAQRRWTSWVWRFFLAGFLYLPVYFFFGAIISPIVLPYYQELGMGLAIPGFEVMFPLEVFRGLLYAVTLFLLTATLRGSRAWVAFWIVLTLAVLTSWQPMLQATWWPVTLRLTHALEITADSIVHGIIVVWLLWTPVADAQSAPDEA